MRADNSIGSEPAQLVLVSVGSSRRQLKLNAERLRSAAMRSPDAEIAHKEITDMNRVPLAFSCIAVAVFAGCATESGITTASPPVVAAPVQQPYVVNPNGTVSQQAGSTGMLVIAPSATPLRPGMGRIESIQAVSAAAGGKPSNSNRVVVKMDDGSTQYFDTQAAGLAIGDRIEVTKNGTMRHPA
jgi:hypothetical protein